MEYLPVSLNLKNKHCALVGAGNVALRKLKHLIQAGATVTIISPEFDIEVIELAKQHHFIMHQLKVTAVLLLKFDLVICATSDHSVNQKVSGLCQAANIWVNVVDDLKHSSFILPAVVDRSPLLITISTSGVSPVLARMIREKLEWFLPKNLHTVLTKLKKLRPAVKDNLASLTERRKFSEWFVERAFEEAIPNIETASQSIIKYTHSAKPSKGKVSLVGAGPGDPELLTVKALKLMQKADIVLHDSLVSEEILLCIRKDAKLIDVGKRALSKSAKQQDINSLLVFYARQGLSVLRLKGGDPFIFGRGGEELEYLLAHKIQFEVVPGITAAMGCASYSGIPLTHREYAQSLMFITAHCKNSEDSLDWINLAREKQTLVVYMGLLRNQVLVDKMIEYGRKPTTPIAIIENGTTTKQRVITGSLNELSHLINQHQVTSPAMIIIGEVTQFADKLNWYENSILVSNNNVLSQQQKCA
jgi:uroporphyrin-III C-methyltransferase/precorrin-2 dehydrogenase/sirohydrochlorin ferrochelatase